METVNNKHNGDDNEYYDDDDFNDYNDDYDEVDDEPDFTVADGVSYVPLD